MVYKTGVAAPWLLGHAATCGLPAALVTRPGGVDVTGVERCQLDVGVRGRGELVDAGDPRVVVKRFKHRVPALKLGERKWLELGRFVGGWGEGCLEGRFTEGGRRRVLNIYAR